MARPAADKRLAKGRVKAWREVGLRQHSSADWVEEPKATLGLTTWQL